MHLAGNQQDGEVLGFQGRDGGTLDQVTNPAAKKLPLNLDKTGLPFHVRLLHERLMAMDVSQETAFAAEIAAWYWVAKAQSHDDHLLLDTFRCWRRKQAVADPASSRRLMIAEAALQKLIDAVSGRRKPDSDPVPAEDNDASSQTSAGEPMDIGIENVEASGSGGMGLTSDTAQESRLPADRTFPTGSNMEPVGPVKTFSKSMARAAALAMTPKKCGRCGQAGHGVYDCPTNINPKFDLKPSKGYKCPCCRKTGDHFVRFCPRNPDPKSIGYLRRRRAASGEAARRSKRSRAGVGKPLDHDGWDRYRPADWLARLSIEDKRPKRKATRSPSPRRAKPKHPWPSTTGHLRASTDAREGRLSCEDERSDNASGGSSVASQRRSSTPSRFGSRSVERMDLGNESENTSLLDVDHASTCGAEQQQRWEAEVLGMILEESGKTDLLLVAEGVECVRAPTPALLQLFKNQSPLWVNKKTVVRRRCCAVDFIRWPRGVAETPSTALSGAEQAEAAEPGLQGPTANPGATAENSDHVDLGDDDDPEMIKVWNAVVCALVSQGPDAQGVLPREHSSSAGQTGPPEIDGPVWGQGKPGFFAAPVHEIMGMEGPKRIG
ncbi:hypothetical protein VTJ83DRAFT_5050 [Remersonia thermophila]|uniref:CCHC-type domain-containing protein n=1 Tax=Remersonia thermophila TaxID=72144 RepID=A0ABR4DBP1_9PEZI